MASRKFLAGSLGFSAGVMLYVSFVEILQKALGAFEEQLPGNERLPYLYATLSFFGGVAVMWALDALVAKLDGAHEHGPTKGLSSDGYAERDSEAKLAAHAHTSNVDVDEWVRKAAVEIQEEDPSGEGGCFVKKASPSEASPSSPADSELGLKQRKAEPESSGVELAELKNNEVSLSNDLTRHSDSPTDPHDKKLVRMGVNTALSIAIHNFPEGLATYVAATIDPTVGATLAIAIAIHNVPEGLCVSIPIYYATGNRWKAFWFGIASGLTEPIGALLGYLVLAETMSQTVYGVMFGMVAGMMVRISLKELLPTAHRYDPEDKVVTHSTLAGMAVMALSLVMFVVV
jgi:ZIP family zinc transporter